MSPPKCIFRSISHPTPICLRAAFPGLTWTRYAKELMAADMIVSDLATPWLDV